MYQNVISTQNVVHFWRHILPYLSFLMKDIITKKDSSSSLMSFTSQTTKTEIIKKLQHFPLQIRKTHSVLFIISIDRYLWNEASLGSKISWTCQTTKNEHSKSLQHFALIVKFYTNLILTQNVVNFWRHIFPCLSFLMKDIITKKTVQVRRCHLQT